MKNISILTVLALLFSGSLWAKRWPRVLTVDQKTEDQKEVLASSRMVARLTYIIEDAKKNNADIARFAGRWFPLTELEADLEDYTKQLYEDREIENPRAKATYPQLYEFEAIKKSLSITREDNEAFLKKYGPLKVDRSFVVAADPFNYNDSIEIRFEVKRELRIVKKQIELLEPFAKSKKLILMLEEAKHEINKIIFRSSQYITKTISLEQGLDMLVTDFKKQSEKPSEQARERLDDHYKSVIQTKGLLQRMNPRKKIVTVKNNFQEAALTAMLFTRGDLDIEIVSEIKTLSQQEYIVSIIKKEFDEESSREDLEKRINSKLRLGLRVNMCRRFFMH